MIERRASRWVDGVFTGLSSLGALAPVGIVALMGTVLVIAGYPAIVRFGPSFLWSVAWDPIDLDFGAGAVMFGTVVTSAIALLLAVPVGLGAAVFLSRLAPPWLSRPVGILIETLAAIPSIAFGFWGVFHLVPWVRDTFGGPGYSLLSAGLILAIMILPLIVAVSRDVLAAVPRAVEEGAAGLGANWWQATWMMIVYGRLGIFGAVVLALARAVGETMAVTMVIGNSPRLSFDLRLPAETMASVLASQYQEASREFYRQSMIYVALVLLVMTVVINLAARRLVEGGKR